MRLRTSLPLCLAAAAVLVPVSPGGAHADTTSCAAPGGRAFPLTTRIHGGPGSYEAGGGYGTWYIDLTNTTGQACTGIHPVVVLVDNKRVLKSSQPKLDFYDGSRARPVTFESTDEQELVGVLDAEGFDGFAVKPGTTVTVKVRLSLTSDAVPDQVTANAALVRRRGEDGDWVGESNDYRFGIGEDGPDGDGEAGVGEPEGTGSSPAATPQPTPQTTPRASPQSTPQGTPSASAPEDDSSFLLAQEAQGGQWGQGAQGAQEAGERARELARTGPGPGPGFGLAQGLLAATATALVTVGTGVYLLARRRR
ncbi:hypothetical protein ACIRU3_03945 [Streptomyces sp. NPDC101151]|uniref:hypothetical protein n=1 Tax=Streptomyces sp. NPDC101151 TaxID=3366115 RepID=UPI00382B65D9